jgi:hypothetical protein
MRKKAVVLVLSFLIICLTPMQIFALNEGQQGSQQVNKPMWTYITEFSNAFDISGTGLFQFETSLSARSSITKVEVNASIQQYINGNWQTIKSWTGTANSNSIDLLKEWYVMSGYYYRLVSTGAVYQNGVLMEQASYTGPSYWY